MTAQAEGNRIGLIGFGEAGQAFAQGWAGHGGAKVSAFDVKMEDPLQADTLAAQAAAHRVTLSGDRRATLARCDAVFCLVTADRARAAATECAPDLAPGTLWLDCNSCAPESKRKAAETIEAVGGRYIDVAVMAPVHPLLHRTPLLISGPASPAAKALLDRLGMQARALSERVGDASAVKMLRSVMIKGMEALFAECLLGAMRAGVAPEVLASLAASNPEIDWPARAGYNLERMMRHGQRRAAEMREVVEMLRALGLEGAASSATAQWQARIGALGLPADGGWEKQAERVLARL